MTNQAPPEAADFYNGRGPHAQYLGSILVGGAPEDVDVWSRFQSIDLDDGPYTAGDYMAEVNEIIGDGTETWPHPYPSSADTSWAYAYDAGSVYVYRHGVEMAVIRCNYTRPGPHGSREPRRPQSHTAPFPAMNLVAASKPPHPVWSK